MELREAEVDALVLSALSDLVAGRVSDDFWNKLREHGVSPDYARFS
jgi:hypothetical protein